MFLFDPAGPHWLSVTSPGRSCCRGVYPSAVTCERWLAEFVARLSVFEAEGAIGSELWSPHNHIRAVWTLFSFPSQGFCSVQTNLCEIYLQKISNWWTAEGKHGRIVSCHPLLPPSLSFRFVFHVSLHPSSSFLCVCSFSSLSQDRAKAGKTQF